MSELNKKLNLRIRLLQEMLRQTENKVTTTMKFEKQEFVFKKNGVGEFTLHSYNSLGELERVIDAPLRVKAVCIANADRILDRVKNEHQAIQEAAESAIEEFDSIFPQAELS